MRLHDPWWLALLPVAFYLAWRRSRLKHQPAAVFSSLAGLRELPVTLASRVRRILPVVECLALALVILALSRPERPIGLGRRVSEGIAINLVVDRSGSMQADDLDEDPWDRRTVRRIDVVKSVVRDFIDTEGDLPGRPNDLLGLVTFAGFVQTHCPLTLDSAAVLESLKFVDIPKVDARSDPSLQELLSTALGDGLVIGVSALAALKVMTRVLVLLSDGKGNVGIATPESAAEQALLSGIKIYAIGIGEPGPDLGEDTLRAIAEKTGGRFYLARSARDLRDAYGEIDRLERTEVEGFESVRYEQLFRWPLGIGLALLVAHRVLRLTRFRSLP